MGNLKLSGLIRTSVFSTFCASREGDHAIKNSAVAVGEFRPKLQTLFNGFVAKGREDAWLEVSRLAGFVRDVIAKSVAYRFAAGSLVHDVAHDAMHGLYRVRPTKDQHEHARTLPVDVAGKVLLHVIAEQFLDRAILGLRRGDDRLGISPNEFIAGSEHPSGDEVESGAGDETGDDSAGARFAHRVRGHNNVGKFFGLHGISSRRPQIQPRRCRAIEVRLRVGEGAFGRLSRQLGFWR